MVFNRNGRGLFGSSSFAVYVLVGLNVAVYALCVSRSATGAMTSDLLFRSGAMYTSALQRHEYWRLVTAGFLHLNPVHLGTNMLCLLFWGGPLEKRVGSLYFILIYLGAVIAGNIVSSLLHVGPYLVVGASGGTSGILGALLCLRLLGKIDLAVNFFVTNIGLNVALTFGVSGIDWQAHVGGFAAGLVVCAILDAVERANGLVLRCKFPEFVKVNLAVALVAIALLLWGDALAAGRQDWPALVVYGVAALVAVKLVDLVLGLKKGLAIVVALLSLLNAAVIALAGVVLASSLLASCAMSARTTAGQVGAVLRIGCANYDMSLAVATGCALLLTILLYLPELSRGLRDVGFVGTSFRAERQRRQGI